MTQPNTPTPLNDATGEAQRATQELIATAHALIAIEAPTLSSEALHQWLHSPEELPLYPTGDGNPNKGTLKT